MNEMTITINVNCPELTAAINNLATALGAQKATHAAGTAPQPVPIATTQQSMPTTPAQSAPLTAPTVSTVPIQQPIAPVAASVQPVQAPVQSAPNYTIEQLQTAIAPLLDAGKVGQIQALVQGFGVNTLMEIPPARYGEFANGLRNLGGVL